jgi:hypothetical protein
MDIPCTFIGDKSSNGCHGETVNEQDGKTKPAPTIIASPSAYVMAVPIAAAEVVIT